MKVRVFVALVVALAALAPHVRGRDGIDSRVLQVRMPNEDVELAYIENRQCFTVELSAKSVSVEGVDLYVGDGKVAVPLRAESSRGIFFQGKISLPTGHVFKKGSTVIRYGCFATTAERPSKSRTASTRATDAFLLDVRVSVARPIQVFRPQYKSSKLFNSVGAGLRRKLATSTPSWRQARVSIHI
jgi:hypothetical protein